MRKMTLLFGIVVFALLAGSASFAQEPPKPMTNDDVVAMVKAGLPDDTIINALHAQETNFDGSAMALVSLKEQGVSPKVMDAMLAASSKRRDPAAAPAAARPAGAGQYSTSPETGGLPAPSTGAPGRGSGILGKLGQIQSQVSDTVQQTKGTVQQTKGTVQSKQGTLTTTPALPAVPAATASSAQAAAQANALQAQQDRLAQQNAAAQQLRQQQIAERQKQAAKYAACKQQAAQAHPQGGNEFVKVYLACIQAK